MLGKPEVGRWPTSFTDLVGVDLPIVQAPIGSASTPRLAAAVSAAGGVGMLALSWTAPDQISQRIREVRELTDRPFGVNVVLEWDQRARVDAALESGARIVSTFWGDPAHYSDLCHQAGAIHVHTVGSAEEACRARDLGVNVLVAQGYEAGGHVWGQVSTMALVPAIVDAVAPIPILAAGGIGDGRGFAAALMLGAAGAWMGTAFLVADESGTHPTYRQRIVDATETDTLYSKVFDGGWPDAPHRALLNSTIRTWQAAGCPGPGARPEEGEVIGHRPDGTALHRYADDLPTDEITGEVEPLAHYAGQSAGVVRQQQSASQIVRDIICHAEASFRNSVRA